MTCEVFFVCSYFSIAVGRHQERKEQSKRKERMSVIINDHAVKQSAAKQTFVCSRKLDRLVGLVSRRAFKQCSKVNEIRGDEAVPQQG
jgi:hypothetical protein